MHSRRESCLNNRVKMLLVKMYLEIPLEVEEDLMSLVIRFGMLLLMPMVIVLLTIKLMMVLMFVPCLLLGTLEVLVVDLVVA
jgi:hypothetical protein